MFKAADVSPSEKVESETPATELAESKLGIERTFSGVGRKTGRVSVSQQRYSITAVTPAKTKPPFVLKNDSSTQRGKEAAAFSDAPGRPSRSRAGVWGVGWG